MKRTILIALAFLALAGSSFLIRLASGRIAAKEYAELISSDVYLKRSGESEKADFPELYADYDHLREVNPDLIGLLYIPALDLLCPVVYGKEDTGYLTHTFQGKKSPVGCVYLDRNCAEDLSSSNNYLFGPDGKSGQVFGGLQRFEQDKTLCKEEPYLYLYTEEAVYKYGIFACLSAEDAAIVCEGYKDEGEYLQYANRSKDRTVCPGIEPDLSRHPELVTLMALRPGDRAPAFAVQGALLHIYDYL